VIKTTLGATVTINSNTPDVNVIDKNQIPGGEFDKSVQNGVDADGNPVYGDSNSAGIGDTFRYKIEFVATNYDGDKQIKYYQVNDQKGDALWAEFNSFTVKVGNKELKRGYYLCLGDPAELNTHNWEYLGTWTAEERANDVNPEWYLVHLGYDQFRITIPWLENHDIDEGVNTGTGAPTYTLTFPDGAKSIYDSPAKVEITYKAAVEGGAQIGGNGHNLYNEAYASWTTEHESGSTNTDRTETQVYGLGLLKDDLATGHNLANAEFRIYSDEACTKPVYVIPTDIEGVYIVDSLGKEVLTGSKMDTSRDIYEKYLAGYLGSDYETTGKQDNLLVTPVNGKVVVLGLAEGTYYLLETKAPDGYNALSTAVPFILNKDNSKPFAVYADGTGKVANIQSASGDYIEKGYQITHTVVHNSQGVELPTTGGKGTFWLITIGTILAIGFAVFLITHKKMSVYTD
jgi:LPXTG-motif cell wall-anchored protein